MFINRIGRRKPTNFPHILPNPTSRKKRFFLTIVLNYSEILHLYSSQHLAWMRAKGRWLIDNVVLKEK